MNRVTKLLEGMKIPGTAEMTFENHKLVDGVQFAGKSTMKIDAQNMTLVYEYKPSIPSAAHPRGDSSAISSRGTKLYWRPW